MSEAELADGEDEYVEVCVLRLVAAEGDVFLSSERALGFLRSCHGPRFPRRAGAVYGSLQVGEVEEC